MPTHVTAAGTSPGARRRMMQARHVTQGRGAASMLVTALSPGRRGRRAAACGESSWNSSREPGGFGRWRLTTTHLNTSSLMRICVLSSARVRSSAQLRAGGPCQARVNKTHSMYVTESDGVRCCWSHYSHISDVAVPYTHPTLPTNRKVYTECDGFTFIQPNIINIYVLVIH